MKNTIFVLTAFVMSICASAAEPIRVACIGDSITYGFGLADRAAESYPAQLQRLLNECFPGGYEVRNFGNSGRGIYLDSMRGSEKRGFRWMPEHKAALAWKPDVVVCNLGINDCGEYIKEFAGGRGRGQFKDDYLALLEDYRKTNPKVKLYIWTKLSPLAEGHRFHRSPEPFLMQADLEEVAKRMHAVGIDMQEPFREEMDKIFARDKIHPNAEGARIIAEKAFAEIGKPMRFPCGLMPDRDSPASLPCEVAQVPHEVWLCAGQSNMQKGWGEFNATPAEKERVKGEMARLAKCNIHFWDFNDGRWSKLTPENALRKSAFGVSFAIRRAEKTGKTIGMLYVAAGGAPAESFLSEQTMCAVGRDGKPLYPHLAAIATNRRRLDRNADFPCEWVAREYPRRRGNSEEASWWPVAKMYDYGIRRIKDGGIKVDGILWYQGESNATACMPPDGATLSDYQLETLRAVVAELRDDRKIPFIMMGLPKMNRPWGPYRAAQRKVCEETGAIYVDTFGAGLGDERDVHPRDKVPFAEFAIEALEGSKRTAVSLVSGGVSAEGVKCGRVALHTWLTSAEFKDISVTAADGRTLWKGLPDPAKCGAKAGQWEVADGVLRQKDVSARDTALVFGEESWTDYTFKAKARTLAGKEGFIVHVRERSPGQCIYANYGGWMNTAHAIETKGAYDFTTPRRLDAAAFKPIETGRWYDLEVSVVGDKVTMKLDGANLFAGQDVPEVVFDARENKVVVDPSKARFPVSEDMWGIFFEDIDFSLDGGVYAELVRNRSFEDGQVECRKQRTIGYWSTVGHATVEIDSSKPLSGRNRNCGRVDALPGGGVANDGYFGIAVKDGAKYRLSVALRGDVRGRVDVALQSLGKTFAAGSIDGVGPEWKTFGLTLEAKGTDPDAKLVFTAPRGGTFYLDCVSLFPCDTYGTSGLFRKDLMERLAALKPSFVRFPGGCWVEGNTMAEAYRWKQTIGNVWDRRTQWNLWGYWSANGVGFHEYLVLCEELGAKALFCINCGMSHKETVPLDKMDEFVQDALDCIEYANGPVTSKWGAARAANGHPAPFNLQYLEIGNENGGEKYYERYALIHDAVRAKYPEIKIVSDVWHGAVKGRPQHIRDEHCYRSPDWFMSAGAKLYDDYPRGEFEVFVGEYAVTRDVGRWGDLRAAIGEAAFMCGLERNADVVKLAAYAPLFANAKHTAWTPNLIYPMTDGNFVNPSWNVQKLFSENRGREVLAFSQESRWMKTKDGKACRAVAVSAVRDADGAVVVKAVNCSEEPQPFTLALAGTKVLRAGKTWFTGPDAHASNSPLVREALKESSGDAKVAGGAVVETLPPLSLTVFHIR